jgi:hypothetical protein
MPDTRKHRGPGPQDPKWFGPDAQAGLRAAVADLSWLFSRGYVAPSAVNLVGDRYRLVERQRVAVLRSACSDVALAGRRSRELDLRSIRGRPLRIDGFNLILTLETALGGGVVLVGRDGCYRDMASVHGTYRRVAETRPAGGEVVDGVERRAVHVAARQPSLEQRPAGRNDPSDGAKLVSRGRSRS